MKGLSRITLDLINSQLDTDSWGILEACGDKNKQVIHCFITVYDTRTGREFFLHLFERLDMCDGNCFSTLDMQTYLSLMVTTL